MLGVINIISLYCVVTLIWAYWKSGTQDPESTQDPGPYEDPGSYEGQGPYQDQGPCQVPGEHLRHLLLYKKIFATFYITIRMRDNI